MNVISPNIYHTQVNDFYMTWLKYRYQVGFVPSIIVSRNGKDKLSAAGMQRIIKSNKVRLTELVTEPIDSVMLQCAIKHLTSDKNFTKYYDQFRRLFIVQDSCSQIQTVNIPFLEKLCAYGYDYSTIFAKLYLHDGCATSLRFILQSNKTVCEFSIKSTKPIATDDQQVLKIHTKQLAILSTMTRKDTYFSWLPGDIKIMIFALLPRGCLLNKSNPNLLHPHRTLNRKECGCAQWEECLCASEWDYSDTDCECADDETRARILHYHEDKREREREHEEEIDSDDLIEMYSSDDSYIFRGVNRIQKNAIALSTIDLDEDLSLMDYLSMSKLVDNSDSISLVTAHHE